MLASNFGKSYRRRVESFIRENKHQLTISKLLTNKNITKILEQRIEESLCEKGTYGVYKIYLFYIGFGKSIVGKYSAWLEEDPSCCPSINGTFNYNPVNFSLTTIIIKK